MPGGDGTASCHPLRTAARSGSEIRPFRRTGQHRHRRSAALRSDPFFADVEGALHGFAWTGHDDFAGNNVDTIALEVPSDMLGDGPIGVWATISLRRDGTLVPMDRGGHPTINPFINPDGEKNCLRTKDVQVGPRGPTWTS